MPNKTYSPGTVVDSGSLNAFNQVSYNILGDGTNPPADKAAARANLGVAATGANSDITSLTGLTTPLSVSQGGTGLTGASWSTRSTGAVTASTGTITSANGVCRYQQMGKTVSVALTINVVNNGTGAGALNIASILPTAPQNTVVFVGRELQVSGILVTLTIGAGNSGSIFTYTNAYPASTGTVFQFNGTYESV